MKPSLEQCERLALALGFPILPESLQPPYYRESLLNLHGLAQKAVQGDEHAGEVLRALKSAFGGKKRPEQFVESLRDG